MADDIQGTTQDMQTLGDQANAVGDVMTAFFNKIRTGASASGVDLTKITSIIDSLGSKIEAASKSFNVMGASANFSTLQDPLDLLIGSFIKLEQVVDQSKIFQQFSADSGAAINTITLKLGGLQQVMKALQIPGADKIIGLAEGLVANANEAEKLENSFVALSAAGGDLDKIFVSQGGQLKDLSALTAAYSNAVANAADATGLSVHQSMDFANALKTIPGVMDQYVSTGVHGAESTTSLIAAMRLMTGTGRSQTDVVKALNVAYDNLSQSQGKINDTAQKGAEFLATISSVSTTLKLRFDDVRAIMESVADQFKFVGNETDAAARILERYTNALRETGLTSKASVDIIRQMIKGISDLGVGTKAFLSLRSGGAGGLQGAFQIEEMLRQGKLDQVVQMAEKSLKQQFGGRVYTQAEAAQSPEAASQFMRQRQLLQSGAFGIGKGMGDDQATRLLEALGRGDTLAATKEIKTGQDALTAATNQGMQIQERNNNELKAANRFLERNAIASELMAGATIRNLFGTMGENATAVRGQMRDAAGTAIVQNENRLGYERGNPKQTEFTQELIIMGRQAISTAINAGKGIASGAVEAAKGVAKTTIDSVNALKGFNTETRDAAAIVPPVQSPTVDNRRQAAGVYARSVGGNAPNVRPNTAPIINAAGQRQQPGQAATTGGSQKLVLEIVAPPGFTAKKINGSSAIQKHNQQSTVVNLDLDDNGPGY